MELKLLNIITEIVRLNSKIQLFECYIGGKPLNVDDFEEGQQELLDILCICFGKYVNQSPDMINSYYKDVPPGNYEDLGFDLSYDDQTNSIKLFIHCPRQSPAYGTESEQDWIDFTEKCKIFSNYMEKSGIQYKGIQYEEPLHDEEYSTPTTYDIFLISLTEFKDSSSIEVLKRRGLI